MSGDFAGSGARRNRLTGFMCRIGRWALNTGRVCALPAAINFDDRGANSPAAGTRLRHAGIVIPGQARDDGPETLWLTV
jgi:hypothetical protein